MSVFEAGIDTVGSVMVDQSAVYQDSQNGIVSHRKAMSVLSSIILANGPRLSRLEAKPSEAGAEFCETPAPGGNLNLLQEPNKQKSSP